MFELKIEYTSLNYRCVNLKETVYTSWSKNFEIGEVYRGVQWCSLGSEFEHLKWSDCLILEVKNNLYLVDRSQFILARKTKKNVK